MRILIVEDSYSLADTLQTALKNENYIVDAVFDGSDGYEYGRTGIYDIIILDYQMDKIDGLETARQLRNGINEFACIIFLTNYGEISIDAYSVDTYRFVLKSTLWDGLYNALDDYRKRMNTGKSISVKSDGSYITIDTDEIVFIES